MPEPVVKNIDESKLSVEERNALAVLKNLPVEKFNALKELMGLGDPGVIGAQTVTEFRQLCERAGLNLSAAGVNAFKDAHKLGNTGAQRGVIGAQTAGVYFDEVTKRVKEERDAQLETMMGVTGTFEGGRFTNLTGNFDGQGISFGFMQWNFGQGSLPPVLKRMLERDEAKFREIFGADADRFIAVIVSSKPKQMEFAVSINDAKNRVKEPWRTRFRLLGEHPPFQEVQKEVINERVNKAKAMAQEYGLKTVRGLSLMFDIVTQNGSISASTKTKIMNEKAAQEKALGRPLTERELLEIIANKRADDANPKWREDVRARKLCIARGSGTVHGSPLDLDAQFGLSDGLWV